MPGESAPTTALVLSGGGARGAYEAGLVRGMLEVLGRSETPPFDIFVGTSVGAINTTFLAAHAHRPDLDVARLCTLWVDLGIADHLVVDLRGVSRLLFPDEPTVGREQAVEERYGPSVLDPRPLESLVRNNIPWKKLHDNVAAGIVSALVVAALSVADGRTSMFAELAPDTSFVPSRDPERRGVPTRITANHVLASAALPILFPSRRIADEGYFCDGGLRFNTPISPAIRCGAERLVVISLRHEREAHERAPDRTRNYPSLGFLLGKIFDALLLDPIRYDLQVLARTNRLVAALEESLTPTELKRVHELLVETRGMAYRKLDTLVFTPSVDLGEIAAEHIASLSTEGLPIATRLLVNALARASQSGEADLASFVEFDGSLAARFIDLGHRDAVDRADEIRDFFAP